MGERIDEMRCTKTIGDERFYDFECPACGENGHIGLNIKDQGQFPCPDQCGASFLEYQSEDGWRIRCVVQPVFQETPSRD